MQNKTTTNSFRYIFLLYISVIIVFSFLYQMPFSKVGHLSYINSLFISTSALSVTGLSSIDISSDLTRIGQSFLIIEMQLGGIGILVLISYLFLIMGKRITMSSLLVISKDQNQSNLKMIKSLSFSVLIIALAVETLCFFSIFGEMKQQYNNPSEAIFVTIFHSVASFTNSGFSLFDIGDYKTNKVVLLGTTLTIFLGSIGYPTIMEYIFLFKKKKSLFTKINVRMHFMLVGIGSLLFFLLEQNKVFKPLDISDKITNSIFLSASTRNGGLANIDIAGLSVTTILIVMCLMFIGGASSSTGGGIRLTTFRVLIAKMVAVAKSHRYTVIGKKTITQEAINKSFLIFFSFILLIMTSTILITLFEVQPLENILFEVISALTNTGLSMGITSTLTNVSKIILMFLMVIGRIGIFTFIYLIFKVDNSKIKFLEEDLAVG